MWWWYGIPTNRPSPQTQPAPLYPPSRIPCLYVRPARYNYDPGPSEYTCPWKRGLRGLENAHLLPLLPERADADDGARLALDVLNLEELVLPSEGEEMREERVEVALRSEVEDFFVVRVVEVREDAEELAVDVLDCRGEVLREVAAWKRGR